MVGRKLAGARRWAKLGGSARSGAGASQGGGREQLCREMGQRRGTHVENFERGVKWTELNGRSGARGLGQQNQSSSRGGLDWARQEARVDTGVSGGGFPVDELALLGRASCETNLANA